MGRVKHGAIYARISDNPSRDGAGVGRQEKECRELAERLGWTVTTVFRDDDRSAYSGKPRPGYLALMRMLQEGEVDGVLAWHPDRLHRSPRELEDFIDVVEARKVRVATVQSGEYDLATAAGRMTARVVGAVARHESEHKSARLLLKHRELAMQGKDGTGGGPRPFGYEDDRLTVRAGEAEIIREMARRVLAGESLWSLVHDLTERGVPTSTGAKWSTTAIKTVLMSARIAGLRSHHGIVVAEAEWPGILERTEWEQVGAVLRNRNRSKKLTKPPRKYLLSGLIDCGVCEERMHSAPRSGGVRGYGCFKAKGGCGGVHILADPLEAYVVDMVFARLDTPRLAEAMNDADAGAARLEARRRALDARTQELAEMWAEGDLTKAEWMAARDRLGKEREALDAEAEPAPATRLALVAEPGRLAATWPSLAFGARHAAIAAVVEAVVVSKATGRRNRFEADRVEVRWRR